jgi:hypothetical protein
MAKIIDEERTYDNVDIPEDSVKFFADFGGVVMRDDRGLYTVWPSEKPGVATYVIPKCTNGAYYVSSQESIRDLKIACAAVFQAVNLIKYNYELASRL